MMRCPSNAFGLRLFVLWLSVHDTVGLRSVWQKRAANPPLGNHHRSNNLLSRRSGYIGTTTQSYSTNLESSSSPRQQQQQVQVLTQPTTTINSRTTTTTTTATTDSIVPEAVPTTLTQALYVFFLDKYNGPRLATLSLAALTAWRCYLAATSALASAPLGARDVAAFSTAVIVWWFQEHFMHLHLLHSKFDWMGKNIHAEHHAKPYHHISIDHAGHIMGWLLTVHVMLCAVLPLPVALSTTVGYTCAGLFYVWAHFIVHTKVRFRKQTYWSRMKDHHSRHHLVDNRYWLGFSVPAIDSLFGTNPNVQEVRRQHKKSSHDDLLNSTSLAEDRDACRRLTPPDEQPSSPIPLSWRVIHP
jgi:hypothetical protein